ncbi:interleukin-36 alpha-like isoform X2 [Nannospalax galili]|uniref:interleukin-36 alpha-like isoform X2 n=1 Tax=Nannospalax galili TaxID=1026970 RepID=UPI000819ED09|nr:interleukin-36 alpha-like isoform X2 [Nannospalax galili]
MDKDKELVRNIPWFRQIQDLDGRVWVFQNESLTAVQRKAHTVPVTIALISCRYPEKLEEGKGDPMYLGLKEPERCLFCIKDGEKPMLQLKTGSVMKLHDQEDVVKPFVFYHNKSGTTSSFESAAFPGWFIAIYANGASPVFLSQELGKTHITDFWMTMV